MIGPTLRTVRYLRPVQIAHRLWRRAREPWFASSWYRLPRPSEPPQTAVPALWPGDAENGRRMLDGQIRLVGLDRGFAPPFDWDAAEMPLLWRFTLHYFDWLDDLAAVGTEAARTMSRGAVSDWIAHHPRIAGPAWHPYPLSLRLHAWLRHAPWLLDGADGPFASAFASALDRQARHLPAVIEHDVAGNHVIKNLKALIAAGVAIPAHARSGQQPLALLQTEIARQVLPDGCHYERSPYYHLQVLCDLIDVATMLGPRAPGWLANAIGRMAGALAFFRLGDGQLALFNDGEVGDERLIESVAEWLGGLPAPPLSLPDAGYARLAAGDTIILFDAGRCCPDDLPAHAHADTLSFEMSVGRRRMIVNCGTYAYQDAAWRNRLRGTPAHSTADIDGQDSAEVHGTFRLGRRPRRVTLNVGSANGAYAAEGSHDGFHRFGVAHRRRLTLGADALSGIDHFTSKPEQGRFAHLHFHLHPDVAVIAGDSDSRVLSVGGQRWQFAAEGAVSSLQESVWAPRFYRRSDCRQIVLSTSLGAPSVSTTWNFRKL